jgi:membrane peptidoglycan carboxypeptidase
MNQELQQASTATNPAAQQQELAQAAEQQEQTAQALETVAKHFDALEQGTEVAETRASLRQNEQQQSLPQELAEQYQLATTADQQAQQTAEEQLKKLETELQNNPEMQQALLKSHKMHSQMQKACSMMLRLKTSPCSRPMNAPITSSRNANASWLKICVRLEPRPRNSPECWSHRLLRLPLRAKLPKHRPDCRKLNRS